MCPKHTCRPLFARLSSGVVYNASRAQVWGWRGDASWALLSQTIDQFSQAGTDVEVVCRLIDGTTGYGAGGPLRRIAVFGAGARMAWEAQDINGRPWQGVGCSSEDQGRACWAGGQDLLGSGIKGENEVGLDDLAGLWLGALFGARGSRGARGVKALEEPLLPTNQNICNERMNIPIAGRETGAVHERPKVRPIVLASQALLLFLGAGFPCWLYESARQALQAPFFFYK